MAWTKKGNLKKNSIIKSKPQSASSGKARHQASNLQHPSTPTPLLMAHPPSPFCLPDENLMKGNIPGKTQHLAHVTKEDNGHEEADDKGLIEKKGGQGIGKTIKRMESTKVVWRKQRGYSTELKRFNYQSSQRVTNFVEDSFRDQTPRQTALKGKKTLNIPQGVVWELGRGKKRKSTGSFNHDEKKLRIALQNKTSGRDILVAIGHKLVAGVVQTPVQVLVLLKITTVEARYTRHGSNGSSMVPGLNKNNAGRDFVTMTTVLTQCRKWTTYAARELLETDLAILNLGQLTRTLDLAPHFPKLSLQPMR
ncbi:hypothetical protein TNCV_1627601 [Trichonephila clavipes]|nr:hypothetical protein TNCV_1627601 [Trichonephila clavipes]